MNETDMDVDYCPIHKSLFFSNNRVDCHSRLLFLAGDSFPLVTPLRERCEWWTGHLIDLKAVYPPEGDVGRQASL